MNLSEEQLAMLALNTRDLFAVEAARHFLSHRGAHRSPGVALVSKDEAEACYRFADTMMAAREYTR